MTNNQLFFSLVGIILALTGIVTGFMKYYLDAKIDPITQQVKLLIDYMVSHKGKPV